MWKNISIAVISFIFCSCNPGARDIPPPTTAYGSGETVNPGDIPSIDTTTETVAYEPEKDTIEKLMEDDITQDIIETALDIIEKALEDEDFDDADKKFKYFERRMDENGVSIKKYAKRIENIRVTLAVEEIRKTGVKGLPDDEWTGKKGPRSNISIENSTSYTLSVYYAGPETKMVIIPPFGSETFSIKSGQYTVGASVAAPKVSGCYDARTFSGGAYSTKYYIETSRF